MAGDDETVTMSFPQGAMLRKHTDWPLWRAYIEQAAVRLRVWSIVNPDETLMTEAEMLGVPEEPTTRSAAYNVYLRKRRAFDEAHNAWLNNGWGDEPQFQEPTEEEIKREYRSLRTLFVAACRFSGDKTTQIALNNLNTIIVRTVDPMIYQVAVTQMHAVSESGTRAMIRALRMILAPSQTAIRTDLISRYNAVLDSARTSRVDPEEWVFEFLRVFSAGLRRGHPIHQGNERGIRLLESCWRHRSRMGQPRARRSGYQRPYGDASQTSGQRRFKPRLGCTT